MNKRIKNANAIACKLGPGLTKTINYKLKSASKKRQKREKMVKKKQQKLYP